LRKETITGIRGTPASLVKKTIPVKSRPNANGVLRNKENEMIKIRVINPLMSGLRR
jgi:hypothetical protein